MSPRADSLTSWRMAEAFSAGRVLSLSAGGPGLALPKRAFGGWRPQNPGTTGSPQKWGRERACPPRSLRVSKLPG